MAITDKERRDLFTAFEEWMGTDNANTAMELLPTQPADQLVTRSDLHAFGAELRAELRGEMAELRAELRGEMSLRFGRLERLIAGLIAANVVAAVSVLVA